MRFYDVWGCDVLHDSYSLNVWYVCLYLKNELTSKNLKE